MKKGKGIYCFLLLLIVNISDVSRLAMGSENLGVKNYLIRINKTPIKSIKSPDGDIIDCIHLSNQPAFDHPLLKNHTIQMRPSYNLEGFAFDDSKLVSGGKGDEIAIKQLWHLSGSCPDGTIPIIRTKEEDILRAGSVERFGKKEYKSIPKRKSADPAINGILGHEHSIAYHHGVELYGAKAIMNVWNPHVEQRNEFSLAQLWILGGPDENLNTLEAGWNISPSLYGNNHTRLFIFWTSDGYKKTGCYNLRCPAFIQINNKIALGGQLAPISAFGRSQQEISILVWRDPKDHNWWLQFGNTIVGYWPENMFNYLLGSASEVQWGGEVVNLQSNGKHTTTQMGSGHFPEEGYRKASYFRNLQIVDGSHTYRDPGVLGTFNVKPNCYRLKLGNGGNWRNYFYFGGPGRNPNCQ